jgi:transcriptional regulator with PAS, ATPase and Fis domain
VQAYHRASRRAGAVVPVNCAAIPHALAERLLFGVKRGAYSGAEADASGYIQDADGGTLFLDEIAELDLQVQAKLLRVLESRELMPLGASKPRRVDFALCSATNKDLRALVASGAWREDLYFRIARPAVTLPPLRNRPEEIPALVADELAGLSTPATAHVSLIEQCLLRPWPGNVRELLAEIRAAAQAAHAEGNRVTSRHLPANAGSLFGAAASGARTPPPELIGAAPGSRTPPPELTGAAPGSRTPPPELTGGWQPPRMAADEPFFEERRRRSTRDPVEAQRQITDALVANGGNVAATARALRMHRTQLRRLIEQYGIVVGALVGTPRDDSSTDDDDS